MVPQEAYLFPGTVRDTIAYGRPDATNAEVEAAARAVGAHEMIAHLDGGYYHEITGRGRNMSAGQRQLLALARAQLVDPDILIMDEATAALDLASESAVIRASDAAGRPAYHAGGRAPADHGGPGRPDRGARRRPGRRGRYARRAARRGRALRVAVGGVLGRTDERGGQRLSGRSPGSAGCVAASVRG